MESLKYIIIFLAIFALGIMLFVLSALLPYMIVAGVIIGLVWLFKGDES